MPSPSVPWITDGEAGNAAVTTRPLKYLLTASGMDVDTTGFTGFIPVYNAKANSVAGTGTAPDIVLHNAFLALAAAAKGIAFYPGGTYIGKNVTVPAGSRLMALPRTATLKLGVCTALEGSPILNVTGSGVSIKGLDFDGNKAAQPADGFADAYDTGPSSTGRAFRCAVKFKDNGTLMSDLTVDDCNFTNTYGSGVATNNISKVRVTNSTFDLCNFEAVYIYSDFLGVTYTKDHQVIGNRVTNGGSGDATTNSSAIVLSSAENFVVSLNVVESVERAGVKMEYCRRGVVSSNSFMNNSVLTFGAIEMQSTTSSMVVHGNKIYNWSLGIILNPQVGQFGRNVTISKNLIENTTAVSNGDGVSVGNGSIENLNISGNTLRAIKRNCIGIQPNGTLRGLSVTSNSAVTTGTGSGCGLLLNVTGGAWRDINVDGNLFDCGNVVLGSAGIYITSGDSSLASLLKLTNNVVDVGTAHNGIREAVACVTSGLCDNNLVDGALYLQSPGFRCGDGNELIAGSGNTLDAPGMSRVALTTPVTVLSQDRMVQTNLTVPGAVVVNLPQYPQLGAKVTIKDTKGDAATNNITINAFAGTTIDTASSISIKGNYGSVTLEFGANSNWRPVGRHMAMAAAITTPNAQTAAYVQADVTSLKTAIDAIRTVLTNAGFTS